MTDVGDGGTMGKTSWKININKRMTAKITTSAVSGYIAQPVNTSKRILYVSSVPVHVRRTQYIIFLGTGLLNWNHSALLKR